jgi:hypothetical protein
MKDAKRHYAKVERGAEVLVDIGGIGLHISVGDVGETWEIKQVKVVYDEGGTPTRLFATPFDLLVAKGQEQSALDQANVVMLLGPSSPIKVRRPQEQPAAPAVPDQPPVVLSPTPPQPPGQSSGQA